MLEQTKTRSSVLLDNKYKEFFLPTILMAMTLTMSIVVDSIIVGNMLGANALAAVNLVLPMVMVYNTVAICLGLGSATLISIAKGRRDTNYADAVFTTLLGSTLVISFIMLAGQFVSLDNIVELLTREPSLRPLVKSYLHVLVWGTPLIILVPSLAYCLRVDGQVKLASTILIISNLVNLALDLVYMGPLKMGIAGSSLATVSGYIIGGLFLHPYIFSDKRSLHVKLEILAAPSGFLTNLVAIAKTGFPAAMGSILITFKILCINHIVLAVAGKSALVAFSVCLSCLSFVSMFIAGTAQAMTPIVGVLFGEKDYRGIRFVVRRTFTILLLASIASIILLESIPGQILELFGIHHPADLAEGIPAIRIFSLSLIGTSITFLSMFYYLTIGRTKLSTAISAVQGAGVVPIALLLSGIMGAAGIWLAFSLAEVITILMILLCYFFLWSKYPQRYNSLLLLDQQELPEGSRFETTCTGDADTLTEVSSLIEAFTCKSGLPVETTEEIKRGVYIAAAAIFNHPSTTGKEKHLDISISIFASEIIVSLRDNETKMSPPQSDELDKKLSQICKLQYSQAIGFNNHNLIFDRT